MDTDLRRNALFALLDDEALAAVAPHLERVTLTLEQDLYREGAPMSHAWFPAAGVLSMLGAGEETHLEVATIGHEGVLGVALFFGAERSFGRVYVQVSGWGWRMPAEAFRAALAGTRGFGDVVHRYSHALMAQMMQSTACNRAHDPEQRCARWLLQTHDRVGGDEFDLKQEFLAQMLGERRATVSRVESGLQARGLIQYTRGRVRVVNRAGLLACACPCYELVRDEYRRMLGREAPNA